MCWSLPFTFFIFVYALLLGMSVYANDSQYVETISLSKRNTPPGSPRKTSTSPAGSPKSHTSSPSGISKASSDTPPGYRKGTGYVDSHGFLREPEFVKIQVEKPASPPRPHSTSPARARGTYYSPDKEEILIAGSHKGDRARTVIWTPERKSIGGRLKGGLKSIGNRLGLNGS